MTIRVLVADDRAVVRLGLRVVIESSDGIVVTGEAVDEADALLQAALQQPDIVLIGLRMPYVNGPSLARDISRLPHRPQVLALGTGTNDDQVPAAVEAGACGLLLQELSCDELLSALHVVAAGGRVIPRGLLRNLSHRATRRNPVGFNDIEEKVATLSVGERRVLRLIGMGLTNKGIADELHLSASSVKTYVSRALVKLDLDSRTQAALVAYSTGLVADTHPTDAQAPAVPTKQSVAKTPLPSSTGKQHQAVTLPAPSLSKRNIPS
ncbi:response regulator transcription factor [Streptomyces sp. MS2.AVA.5]|uniref:Response regulator transcription factor n=1 Tax=Streptomyces achmelvichensis TaxID=3134111 RepID=A0ACC6PL49_9ACTN